jgi:hypothetical protein
MGMRSGEEAKTEKLLRSLEFYPVTWEVAQLAGDFCTGSGGRRAIPSGSPTSLSPSSLSPIT